MKILITGGLGHIGSYLLRNFTIPNKKINFFVYDNLISERFCSIFNLKNKNTFNFDFSNLDSIDIKKNSQS